MTEYWIEFPVQYRGFLLAICFNIGFPGGSYGKEFACIVGDQDSIPGSEHPPEKGMATHSSMCITNSFSQFILPSSPQEP